MKMIVRADDLGHSEAVNYGILKSVQDGIINNVGLMVNLAKADHGYQLISETDTDIGLHANISLGKPVSDAKEIPSLVNEKQLKSSSEYREAEKDFVVLEEATAEVEKQVELYQKKYNEKPAYIDFHAVFSPTFIEAVEIIADKYDIPFVGMNLDGSPVEFEGNKLALNVSSGESEVELLEQFKKVVENKEQSITDLMVFHPGYIDVQLLKNSSLIQQRIYDTSFLISSALKKYLTDQEVELLKFHELKN